MFWGAGRKEARAKASAKANYEEAKVETRAKARGSIVW